MTEPLRTEDVKNPANQAEMKLVAELNQNLIELKSAVKERDEKLAKYEKDLLKHGDTTTRNAEEIKAINAQYTQIKAELDAERKRNDGLEVKLGRPGFGIDQPQQKSLGELFCESELGKKMLETRSAKLGEVLTLKNLPPFERKLISEAASSAGDMVIPDYRPGVIALPERDFKLRDLFNNASTTSNQINYFEETGFANLYTTLTAQALIGQPVVTVESTAGFCADMTVYANGTTSYIVQSVDATALTITMTTNLSATYASGTTLTADEYTPTAENGYKPWANIVFDEKTSPVRTLASGIPVTNQVLEDIPYLQDYINRKLVYGLRLSEEKQFLYGDGLGQNLSGVLTNASIQSLKWSDCPADSTRIDVIRRAINLSRLALYPVTGLVVHPTDWMEIELTKDDDKRYILLNIPTNTAQQMIWRVPVVDTLAINAGTALLGAFKLGATVYDRHAYRIEVADQHSDWFMLNKKAIRIEERIAFIVERPESFVDITLDHVYP